jgi:GTP-binding protein YchF
MLQAGIVGLPNVGKSTLFNALTAQESALAANYPFATIEPNIGIVVVPDERLPILVDLVKAQKEVPATVEFVDIAGLVRGASKGEGLGNQFLANIRETDAVIQVVRCFEDENVIHVEGSVNPIRDIETIQIELALADLASVEKRRDKAQRGARAGDKAAKAEIEVLDKIYPVLEEGRPARAVELSKEEQLIAKQFFLISTKPTIYAANVDEDTLMNADENAHVQAVREHAAKENAEVVVICAKLEAELVALEPFVLKLATEKMFITKAVINPPKITNGLSKIFSTSKPKTPNTTNINAGITATNPTTANIFCLFIFPPLKICISR